MLSLVRYGYARTYRRWPGAKADGPVRAAAHDAGRVQARQVGLGGRAARPEAPANRVRRGAAAAAHAREHEPDDEAHHRAGPFNCGLRAAVGHWMDPARPYGHRAGPQEDRDARSEPPVPGF